MQSLFARFVGQLEEARLRLAHGQVHACMLPGERIWGVMRRGLLRPAAFRPAFTWHCFACCDLQCVEYGKASDCKVPWQTGAGRAAARCKACKASANLGTVLPALPARQALGIGR